ncbi:hypothetical protein V2S66_14385 [Streptomyces sp. V4-01]|uniref:Type VII secretion protein EccE n=1 Tax=Actinacidiphila polyblastidii TaxID=3110430 RepID=A0ABU7PBG3_9ACTN|nr:hypothetical protein [Streptomyces sp. V4-01]
MHIHQAVPVEGWTPLAQADRTLALSWNSGASALTLALAELLLLVGLLLHFLVRRQGGRRRAWRRLSRHVRLTRRAFSDPVREFLHFRAAVRQLTRLLGSEGAATVAHRALDAADAAVRPDAAEAFGFAVTVRLATRRDDGEVTVRLAGRDVPAPEGPWRTDRDPLVRYASAADAGSAATESPSAGDRTAGKLDAGDPTAGDPGAEPPATPRVLVPLGLADDGAAFLDLTRGPRILNTYGERRAIGAFVQAVAAYLDLPGGAAEVRVARGVLPRFDGPDLDALLDALAAPAPERTRPVVVVCAAPDDEQAARLSEMAGAGLLCAVVVGPMPAHRWEVRVDSRGRTETPGLGIETDAAPLGPAVARTARRSGARRRRGGQPKGLPARPAGPRPPAGGPDPRLPAPKPDTSASRQPPIPAAGSAVPAAAARTAARAVPGARGARPAGPAATPDVRRTAAAGAPPARLPEPLAPAVRDLFAEPEITGVSAAATPATEPFETPRTERRNEA